LPNALRTIEAVKSDQFVDRQRRLRLQDGLRSTRQRLRPAKKTRSAQDTRNLSSRFERVVGRGRWRSSWRPKNRHRDPVIMALCCCSSCNPASLIALEIDPRCVPSLRPCSMMRSPIGRRRHVGGERRVDVAVGVSASREPARRRAALATPNPNAGARTTRHRRPARPPVHDAGVETS